MNRAADLAERAATELHRAGSPLPRAPAPVRDREKVCRYEAHISRELYRGLHELEATQARRRGQAAPLARVEVHGIPEPAA